jgi:hypothetical protein
MRRGSRRWRERRKKRRSERGSRRWRERRKKRRSK